MVLLLGKIWYDLILVVQKTCFFTAMYICLCCMNQETNKPKLSQWSRKPSQELPQMFESHEVYAQNKPKEGCMVDPMISQKPWTYHSPRMFVPPSLRLWWPASEARLIANSARSCATCMNRNGWRLRSETFKRWSSKRLIGKLNMEHGSLNVSIEHHPTIRYMVYNGYYKVMSNIP